MTTLTDSKNLEETVEKDAGVVADKRLRIVVSMLRESFGLPHSVLRWIPTHTMVADALTKIMEAGILMSFMSGRDYKFTAPTPKAKKLIQMLTMASLSKRAAGYEHGPKYEISRAESTLDTFEYSAEWVFSWMMWLRGAVCGVAFTLVLLLAIWAFMKFKGVLTITWDEEIFVPVGTEIAPAKTKAGPKGKKVRDVMTMSQTTYVKSHRHLAVNNYEGDVFTGTPYERK